MSDYMNHWLLFGRLKETHKKDHVGMLSILATKIVINLNCFNNEPYYT